VSKAIIISASTADYFPLLCGMLSSVVGWAVGDGIATGVLSLGLTAQQRELLEGRALSSWSRGGIMT
jgi:hypothetical protein